MAKVKLSDVIIRANTKVDKDNTDLIYYVGGEHFCSGDVTVDQKGLIAGSTIGPMFYYGFKAGQFLLVSRNPHLRKAGVVNFDGICSEKTFVLESADPQVLSPAYLPFVLQNERFWNYAVEHKHGSTNFFINWSTLANYEFELPELAEQERIARLAWAAQMLKKKYINQVKATDELVKSQFIEMFYGHRYPSVEIGSVLKQTTTTEYISDTLSEKYVTVALHGNGARERNIDVYDPKPFMAYRIKAGQFIYSRIDARNGAFSIVPDELENAVVSKDFPVFDIDVSLVLPPVLLFSVLDDNFIQQIKQNSLGSTNRQRIKEDVFLRYHIVLPPMEVQQQFQAICEQSDKSKLFGVKHRFKYFTGG